MKKTIQSFEYPVDDRRGMKKTIYADYSGSKGHSKPGNGGTQAGPPPPPLPQSPKK